MMRYIESLVAGLESFWHGLFIPVLCAMALVSGVRAECDNRPLALPDLETLNLPEGEHVVVARDSLKGKIEARVTVKNKVVSQPVYYLGGKRLIPTPESKVPKTILDCLKKGHAASSCESWFGNLARTTLNLIVPDAEAAMTKCVIKSASCNQNMCCALACCGTSCAVGCALY